MFVFFSSGSVTSTPRWQLTGTPAVRRAALLLAGVVTIATAVAACSSGSTSSSSEASSAAKGTAAAAPKGTPISIGIIDTLTGPQAPSNDQGATVAPAWADWINAAGGIGGHPVKVIVLDDKTDPATAQANEKQLASDGVAAIIASSDNTVSAFDSAAIADGIPLIGGPSDEQDWYVKPGMFVTMTGIVNGEIGEVRVAVQNGHAKKFANVYCIEVAACAETNPTLAAAAKAAGIGYTQLAISSTAPSYTAQCLQLAQEKADYVQLNIGSAVGLRFIQDCQAQGYNPVWGASEQAINSALVSIPNLALYGPAYAFPSVANAPPAATFRAVMHENATNGNWREGTASFTWDGLQALAQAVRNEHIAASIPVTAADVMAGLYSFKGENLGGELANKVTYTKGKAFGFTANPCYFIVGVKNGQIIAPAGLTPQCPGKP
jgi:branched-chain amino acid transport system substrate-binding protein